MTASPRPRVAARLAVLPHLQVVSPSTPAITTTSVGQRCPLSSDGAWLLGLQLELEYRRDSASERVGFTECSRAIHLLELLLDRDQLDETPP